MTIESFNKNDVARQAELMVLDFLKTSNCKKAFECLSAKCAVGQSEVASELFSLDMNKKKLAAAKATAAGASAGAILTDRGTPLLLHLVRSCERFKENSSVGDGNAMLLSPTSSCSSVGSPRDSSGGSSSESEEKWTKSDISLLKKAIKATSSVTDKSMRWKQIAGQVGKSKKQCYLKYKQLREEKHQKQRAKDDSVTTAKANAKANANANATTEPTMTSVTAGSDTTTSGSSTKIKQRLTSDSSDQQMALAGSGKIQVQTAVEAKPPTLQTNKPDKNASTEERMMLEEVEDALGSSSFGSVRPLPRSSNAALSPSSSSSTVTGAKSVPLSKSQLDAVQAVLLPSDKKNLTHHWSQQGFFFCAATNLKYGLVQHEGGPCGVLAVVQAFVLRFLLLADDANASSSAAWQNPTRSQQETALTTALAHILWQASNKRQASLLLNNRGNASDSSKRGFLDDVVVCTATSQQELRSLIASNLPQFMEPKGNGLVLFVASVVMTRSAEAIKHDMDSSSEVLIGSHDYCTQEMVNLLLTGQASTNVFNGHQRLDDEVGSTGKNEPVMVLKGITTQTTIGFLSLFEAYEHLVVGTYLKNPLFNIWVICSESHYSVLFAEPTLLRDPILDQMKSFDLFYFDGLASQNEVIRLTIHPQALAQKPKPRPDDLIPPLNLVIQTRWPLGTINWNGVDPLL